MSFTIMKRSILVGGEDLAAVEGDEAAEGDEVDGVLDEADAAVAEEALTPPGWYENSSSLAPALLPAVTTVRVE